MVNVRNAPFFFTKEQADRVESTRDMLSLQEKAGQLFCVMGGDGVDYRDQHLHPTCNSLCAQQWYDSYGAVYENLIANGLMSVMADHTAQPYVALDANPELTLEEAMMPATLSKTLLTDVLRGKYGFNDVITSEATIMGGYCMAMERRKAIPASIMAGCGWCSTLTFMRITALFWKL